MTSKTGLFDYLEELSYDEVKEEVLKFFTLWNKILTKDREEDDHD